MKIITSESALGKPNEVKFPSSPCFYPHSAQYSLAIGKLGFYFLSRIKLCKSLSKYRCLSLSFYIKYSKLCSHYSAPCFFSPFLGNHPASVHRVPSHFCIWPPCIPLYVNGLLGHTSFAISSPAQALCFIQLLIE